MPFFQGYLAQGVGGPNGFVENANVGYARFPVSTTELLNGGTSLATPSFIQSQAPAVITQRALYDAPTGGNLILWWMLSSPVTATATSVERIRAGALSHTFPALQGGAGTGSAPIDFLAGQRIGTTFEGSPIMTGTAVEVKNGSIAALAIGGGASSGPAATTPRTVTTGVTATLATTDYVTNVNQTTPAAITITMPASPTAGYPYVVSDYAGVAAANPITLAPNSAQTIRGNAVIASNGGAKTLYWIPNLNAYVVAA